MAQLKKGAHTTYQTKYHLVWIPKYRFPILDEELQGIVKNIFRGISLRYGFEIDTMEVEQDHVHLLVSFPPRYSIAEVVQKYKGVSSRILRKEYLRIMDKLWGANLWGRGYFASTINDKTTSTQIRKYIENQKKQQKQLNFLDQV